MRFLLWMGVVQPWMSTARRDWSQRNAELSHKQYGWKTNNNTQISHSSNWDLQLVTCWSRLLYYPRNTNVPRIMAYFSTALFERTYASLQNSTWTGPLIGPPDIHSTNQLHAISSHCRGQFRHIHTYGLMWVTHARHKFADLVKRYSV